MLGVGEVHFRVAYLLVAAGVLVLLRKPLRNRETPGSRWFALSVGAVSVWLACVGLYYVATDLTVALTLYNIVLFAITVCFLSWLLIAVEFATGRRPPTSLLVCFGVLAAGHVLLLWTNYFWLHELVYTASGTYVDDGGGLNTGRGPGFWIHIIVVYVIVCASSVVFIAEWLSSDGPRHRQAGFLAITPVAGVVTSLLWFAEVLRLPFDPTPLGVSVGIALAGWALYRTSFLEITPIATRTVVEEMPDAVVILDDQDRVVEWNHAARNLFGVGNASIGTSASSFFESVPPDARARVVGTDGSDGTDIQIAFDVDGHQRQFSVIRFPVGGDHDPIGRAVVFHDTSALKRRETQLLAQNERLEAFTDIVSHDLQGPIMEIRGSANMTMSTGDLTHVNRVVDAVDRIDDLVTDLLALARTGRDIDDAEPIDLDDVAHTAWSCVWAPSAELVVETDRTVMGDPNRVRQLFENLFRNAVEHGHTTAKNAGSPDAEHAVRRSSGSAHTRQSADDRHGPGDASMDDTTRGVTPSTTDTRFDSGDHRPLESSVRILVGSSPDGFYVEDDGPGIAPSQRERVFERGYTDSSTGTGIGLSIVRQVADAHGWSVRATAGRAGGARIELGDVAFHGVGTIDDDPSVDQRNRDGP